MLRQIAQRLARPTRLQRLPSRHARVATIFGEAAAPSSKPAGDDEFFFPLDDEPPPPRPSEPEPEPSGTQVRSATDPSTSTQASSPPDLADNIAIPEEWTFPDLSSPSTSAPAAQTPHLPGTRKPTQLARLETFQARQYDGMISPYMHSLLSANAHKGSAVTRVRKLLEEFGHLSTQQIWRMGTLGERPIIVPAQVLDGLGRIKMKKTSTHREGRVTWKPPPVAPLPDHPFKSVAFLKATILAGLEGQGLIYKCVQHRPLATPEEFEAAVKQADKETRRAERNALRDGLPVPPPKEPATTVAQWGWRIGPRPSRVPREGTTPPDSTATISNRRARAPPEEGPPTLSPEEMPGQWIRAEKMEAAYHRTRALEAEEVMRRKAARQTFYQQQKEGEKAARQEIRESGLADVVRAERERLEALRTIEAYARATGEDVSGWFAELGKSEGEPVKKLFDDEPPAGPRKMRKLKPSAKGAPWTPSSAGLGFDSSAIEAGRGAREQRASFGLAGGAGRMASDDFGLRRESDADGPRSSSSRFEGEDRDAPAHRHRQSSFGDGMGRPPRSSGGFGLKRA